MANDVFANNMEISCKAADGKSVCAFPDVCMTPPENPATPPGVPVPYPNTGFAKDTTSGSTSVKISGKEVMLKNKSYFKKSTGDEAGSAAKKGVLTSVNRGKVYFNAWSMDVKFEGENVVRNLDLTTHNHASQVGQTPPWPYADTAAISPTDACKKEKKKIQKHCSPEKDWKRHCPTPPPDIPPPPTDKSSSAYTAWQAENKARLELFDDFASACKDNPCIRARKCMLVPYKEKKQSGPKGDCCPGQTGHHLIEAASFTDVPGWNNYDKDAAPCVCAEGPSWHTGSHRDLHLLQAADVTNLSQNGKWSRKQATETGAHAHRKAFPGSGCSKSCIKAQLDKGHDNVCTVSPEPELNANVNAPKDPELRGVASAIMGR